MTNIMMLISHSLKVRTDVLYMYSKQYFCMFFCMSVKLSLIRDKPTSVFDIKVCRTKSKITTRDWAIYEQDII